MPPGSESIPGSEEGQRWKATDPHRAAQWLKTSLHPWWIGGGWAIDLFLGETTRAHHDLDVGIFRTDERDVRRLFTDWEFASAHAGRLDPLSAEQTCPRISHSIWCRPAGADEWVLELVLEESEGNEWVYRRDPRIRLPMSSVSAGSNSGLPILAPEIELLYKSKATRPKDAHDFAVVAPRLSREARMWLREALAAVAPGHPWIEELDSAP
jgi:hypothetical protein